MASKPSSAQDRATDFNWSVAPKISCRMIRPPLLSPWGEAWKASNVKPSSDVIRAICPAPPLFVSFIVLKSLSSSKKWETGNYRRPIYCREYRLVEQRRLPRTILQIYSFNIKNSYREYLVIHRHQYPGRGGVVDGSFKKLILYLESEIYFLNTNHFINSLNKSLSVAYRILQETTPAV